ncbi:MAG: hypothetical protein HMLIMOIP_001949 [Candidatus Nitrosomirales archaeon]|jgi:hypothetical protein
MEDYPDEEIKKMVEETDRDEFEDRSKRLKFLISVEGKWLMTAPALATAYYDEAKLCWYSGALVATIIMARLSLEELIRSHYRNVGLSKKLKSGKNVDVVGFSELIDETLSDRYISEEEATKLREIRNYSEPYIHTKSIRFKEARRDKSSNFLTQSDKIYAPDPLQMDVEDEAGSALQIMISLFQGICNRTGGL